VTIGGPSESEDWSSLISVSPVSDARCWWGALSVTPLPPLMVMGEKPCLPSDRISTMPSARLRHQPGYVRKGEIQRPNPDFVVPFHGLISFLFVARDNIQKEAASNRLVGYIVPPALIFRPPAHLTAHGSYLLAPGTQKAAIEDAATFVQTEIGLPACPQAALYAASTTRHCVAELPQRIGKLQCIVQTTEMIVMSPHL
jgi:hypothetical protein